MRVRIHMCVREKERERERETACLCMREGGRQTIQKLSKTTKNPIRARDMRLGMKVKPRHIVEKKSTFGSSKET